MPAHKDKKSLKRKLYKPRQGRNLKRINTAKLSLGILRALDLSLEPAIQDPYNFSKTRYSLSTQHAMTQCKKFSENVFLRLKHNLDTIMLMNTSFDSKIELALTHIYQNRLNIFRAVDLITAEGRYYQCFRQE